MIVNRGNMGEVCVLFVTLLYAPGASSAQSDACRTLVQPSDSEYLDCPPLVTTRLLNRNVNQPTNCPRYRRSTTCVLSLRHHQGTTHQRFRTLQVAAASLRWMPQLRIQGSTKSMGGHRSSYCHRLQSLLQLLSMATPTPINVRRRTSMQHQRTQLRLLPFQVVLLYRSPTFPVV